MEPISFMPPEPPAVFVGREKELAWLEREVSDRGFGVGETIGVVGQAGIGKTALVGAFCAEVPKRRRLAREVAWIQCRNFNDQRDAFDSFIRADTGRAPDRMIVVLDGADEISDDDSHQALGYVLNYKLVGSVIVTNRDKSFFDRTDLFGRRTSVLTLGPLEHDSVHTLLSQIGSFDEDESFRLLDAIRGHPLTATLLMGLAARLKSEEFRRLLNGQIYGPQQFPAVEKTDLIKVVRPTIVSATEAMVEALKKQPDGVMSLTPRQFEELLTELLRDMGWDVELTPTTRDGGKDILAYLKTDVGKFLCLVEAKRYRRDRKIGVELVRTLYGTLCDYQANSAMLVTTSSFSRGARLFEQKHEFQLGLRDYTDVVGWIMKHGRKGRQVH